MILSPSDYCSYLINQLPQPTNVIPNDFASRIITAPQVDKIWKACSASWCEFEFQIELLQSILNFNRLTCLEQKDAAYRSDNIEIGVDYHGIIILTIGGFDEDALYLRLDSDTNIVIQEVAL